MAEYLLRARGALEVTSAGTFALVGEAVDPPSAAALSERGIDASAHRARQFTPALAAAADLVLTAERAHRDEIIGASPALFRRVFTMREFARLAVPGAPDPAAAAAARRGQVAVVDAAADDVRDPFRGTVADARTTAALLAEVADAVARALGLARRRPSPRPR